MSGFDKGAIYTTSVLQGDSDSLTNRSLSEIEKDFTNFINNFRIGEDFIYRDNLRSSLLAKIYNLSIDLNHLLLFNEDLGYKLSQSPAELLPLFETSLTNIAKSIINPLTSQSSLISIPQFQISLKSQSNLVHFRNLNVRLHSLYMLCLSFIQPFI